MKYVASFAVGITVALVSAIVYTLLSSGISYKELGWGGYFAIDGEITPRFLAVLLAMFVLGFFWTLRRASR
jgi:hypothetical protein